MGGRGFHWPKTSYLPLYKTINVDDDVQIAVGPVLLHCCPDFRVSCFTPQTHVRIIRGLNATSVHLAFYFLT